MPLDSEPLCVDINDIYAKGGGVALAIQRDLVSDIPSGVVSWPNPY